MLKRICFRKKYIITAGIVLLFVIISAAILLIHDSKPDPVSAHRILQQAALFLGKEPNELTDENLAQIKDFRLGLKEDGNSEESLTMELRDIKMLEKFTNLQTLYIEYINYPQETIPKWMIVLVKFGIINFDKRFALDLSPIKNLKTLEKIYIKNKNIKDIKPLEGLENLNTLSVINTQVSNLEPLRNLVNLKSLFLRRTPVSDLKPLKELTNLQSLYIDETQVSNIEPLKALKDLQTLGINGCNNISDQQIEDLQKALPNLQILR